MTVEAVPDLSALDLGTWEILLRIGLAMLIGGVIGTEREYTHRPAGMRTHMLVALGACSVMCTSQLIFAQYRAYGAVPDPARLSAQVITGMGFLGAGTILKEGVSIKGLTTAASIWATACLGIAIGGGYYNLAVIGAGGMLITLIFFEWLQEKILRSRIGLIHVSLLCRDVAGTVALVSALAAGVDAIVTGMKVDELESCFQIHFRADFGGRHANDRVRNFIADLSTDPQVSSLTYDREKS